ncbi:MAG: hypothetical protein Q8R91_04285 [Candidatus Omnitrophota bacterium]|nr:hypothetical protein [Candidatus Omnitrophota bacterium]
MGIVWYDEVLRHWERSDWGNSFCITAPGLWDEEALKRALTGPGDHTMGEDMFARLVKRGVILPCPDGKIPDVVLHRQLSAQEM